MNPANGARAILRERAFARCCWSVSGAQQIVWAYVFDVPGYDKLWATITSAGELSAAQVLTVNAARFRQEDGFRDHKQRLGMEECHAWTKEPILRTFQVQMLALTLLRLIQFRLDAAHGAEGEESDEREST